MSVLSQPSTIHVGSCICSSSFASSLSIPTDLWFVQRELANAALLTSAARRGVQVVAEPSHPCVAPMSTVAVSSLGNYRPCSLANDVETALICSKVMETAPQQPI